jgi:glycosyltransferase involved in cell wall biosynthesis
MRILFYTPLNTRCRDIESQAIAFRDQGHSIFLLTQSGTGELHRSFAAHGFSSTATERPASSSPYLNILQRVLRLATFCRSHKIDLVYSHLEPANFVAVLAQYVIKARVVVCRHHMDYAKLNGFDRDRSYRMTYRLAKDIIVVSSQTKSYMVKEEHVTPEKIHVIKLTYNFDLYGVPDVTFSANVRKNQACELLLITVCRLTPFKRPEISIQLIRNLRDAGLQANLLILGDGEYRKKLEQQIINLGLEENVTFTGYVTNVLDYLKASDVLIHPSVSEASCITVKEAGLVSLPVVACKDVGDFDEVIQHGQNGFLFDVDKFLLEVTSLLITYTGERHRFEESGKKLNRTILSQFDIRNVADYYEKTFHQKS